VTNRALVLILASAGLASAHDVITTKITWSKEVSRLVFKRCASCHREGGSAFSLMTYDEARPWAKAIKEEVLERRMPPWEAVKGFGEFKDDRGLSGEEIEVISDWVEGGAPEGDPKYVPALPKEEAWLDPVTPAGAKEVVVGSDAKIAAGESLVAIRPEGLKEGSSVQLLAARPDGTVEPLLWIYQYNPKFKRTYYYTSPVNLPAGTRIEMSPPDAGKVALFGEKKSVKPSGAGGLAGRPGAR
jgi:hypothetical protein